MMEETDLLLTDPGGYTAPPMPTQEGLEYRDRKRAWANVWGSAYIVIQGQEAKVSGIYFLLAHLKHQSGIRAGRREEQGH